MRIGIQADRVLLIGPADQVQEIRRHLERTSRRVRVIAEVHTGAPIDEQSPERVFAARESSRAISRALSALPPDEATVLILARLEGFSYEDIGSVIGRSATAAKQLAYRALKRVRADLVAAGHGEVSR